MNSKIFFLSVAVLFLLVVSLSSDVVFADKPDKENFKENREEVKAERQSDREEAKAERQSDREEAKAEKQEIKEFGEGDLVTSSSTTSVVTSSSTIVAESLDTMSICHIPPGNPGNNHTITIGKQAWQAHERHGDEPKPCDEVDWEKWNEDNQEERVLDGTENANLVEQLSQQIAELQKRLQQLFGF